jgi:hypothetical protein
MVDYLREIFKPLCEAIREGWELLRGLREANNTEQSA